MPNFKLTLVITSLLALLTACHLPKPEKSQDLGVGSATYLVDDIKGNITASKLITGSSIPEAKVFHFSACVKSIKQLAPIINHLFKISGDNFSTEATTDASGCLNWEEEIKYNPVAQAKFISLERTITAHGLQKGSRLIKFAINPWEEKVLDLEKHKAVANLVSKEQNTPLAQGDEKSKSVYPEDIRVMVEEKLSDTSGMTFRLQIKMTPTIETKLSSGAVKKEAISEGEFLLKIYLISSLVKDSKEIKKVISSSNWINSKIEKGFLLFNPLVTISELEQKGQIYLGIELKPNTAIGEKLGLKKYEGVFTLGDFDSLKGTHFSRELKDADNKSNNFTISQFIEQQEVITSNVDGKKSKDLGLKAGYQIAQLQFIDRNTHNDTSLDRNREFTIKICAHSRIDKKPIKGFINQVTNIHGQKQILNKSDTEGCSQYTEVIKYNYLDIECEKKYSIQVENADWGINENIPIIINPWDEKSSFARDLRPEYVSDNKNLQPKCSKDGQAKIRLRGYSFDLTGFNYEIDELLSLKVFKTFNFSLDLGLLRPSLSAKSNFEENANLPPGEYTIRYALVDNLISDLNNPGEFIYDAGEATYTLEGGNQLIGKITFATYAIKSIGNITSLYMQIIPKNAKENLHTPVYRANFIMQNGKESAVFIPAESEIDLTQLKIQHQKANQQRLQNLKNLSSKEYFAKENHLQILSLDNSEEMYALAYHMNYPLYARRPVRKNLDEVNNTIRALNEFHTNRKQTAHLNKMLCRYWTLDYLSRPAIKVNKNLESIIDTNFYPNPEALNQLCLDKIKTANGLEGFFDIESRYFVTKPKFIQAHGGFVTDYVLSSSFGYVHAQSQNYTETSSVDYNAGLSTPKQLNLFSGGGGYRKQYAFNRQEAKGIAVQQQFSAQVTVSLEQIPIRFTAEVTNKCVVIKPKVEIFLSLRNKNILNQKLDQDQLRVGLQSGFLICDNKTKGPVEFVENYYVINQRNTNTALAVNQYTGANRPLYISLRGDHDLLSLTSALHEDHNLPEQVKPVFNPNFGLLHIGSSILNGYDDPDSFVKLHQRELLMGRQKAFFLRGLSTFPGQIVLPR